MCTFSGNTWNGQKFLNYFPIVILKIINWNVYSFFMWNLLFIEQCSITANQCSHLSLFLEPWKIILVRNINEPIQQDQYPKWHWKSNACTSINQRNAIDITLVNSTYEQKRISWIHLKITKTDRKQTFFCSFALSLPPKFIIAQKTKPNLFPFLCSRRLSLGCSFHGWMGWCWCEHNRWILKSEFHKIKHSDPGL